jgi:2-dehydropantoate 2-reductase
MYAHHLSQRRADVRIVADDARVARYKRDGIFCNGERCEFRYLLPDEGGKADLLIFAVKQGGLQSAIEAAHSQVGENTIVLSLLNGIVSERIIGEAYGDEHVLLCVAQGVDAVMAAGRLTYHNMGQIVFGDREKGVVSDMTRSADEFFTRMEVPHIVDTDMQKRQWGKFMLNVGVNQAIAVYGETYADAQKEGYVRDVMIAAMREVLILSEKEGVGLTEKDLNYWVDVVSQVSPEGKPSTRQDVEARRFSEVELFSGTVLTLAKKHGVDTPVNRDLYERITELERGYAKD